MWALWEMALGAGVIHRQHPPNHHHDHHVDDEDDHHDDDDDDVHHGDVWQSSELVILTHLLLTTGAQSRFHCQHFFCLSIINVIVNMAYIQNSYRGYSYS